MRDFILASASPRRFELLSGLGIAFDVEAADIDESVHDRVPVRERVCLLARDKAAAVDNRLPACPREGGPRWILAADTLVHVDDDLILGKPADKDDALAMIRAISGREHFVHTGLALVDRRQGLVRTALSESRVRFAALSENEVEDYVAGGDWRDVAGGYRIQGEAARYIERIEGSWSGIVGLPIHDLYVILQQSGYVLAPRRELSGQTPRS